jgi:hypothetical protein
MISFCLCNEDKTIIDEARHVRCEVIAANDGHALLNEEVTPDI